MIQEEFKKEKELTLDPSERFLSEIRGKLDGVPSMFVKPKFLSDIGIYGSHSAAVQAIQAGEIPHVKVSPYRILIEKQAVLDFVKSKFRSAKISA